MIHVFQTPVIYVLEFFLVMNLTLLCDCENMALKQSDIDMLLIWNI